MLTCAWVINRFEVSSTATFFFLSIVFHVVWHSFFSGLKFFLIWILLATQPFSYCFHLSTLMGCGDSCCQNSPNPTLPNVRCILSQRSEYFRRAFGAFEAFFVFWRSKIGARAKKCEVGAGSGGEERKRLHANPRILKNLFTHGSGFLIDASWYSDDWPLIKEALPLRAGRKSSPTRRRHHTLNQQTMFRTCRKKPTEALALQASAS